MSGIDEEVDSSLREATTRIELVHRSFADSRVSTSPRGQCLYFNTFICYTRSLMKILKTIIIVVISLTALCIAGFFLIGYLNPKPGGIRIETTPTASVYIDDLLVGETPFQGTHDAGKILLRLVPQGSSENLIPFETSITLISGVETAVGRNFASTEDKSSGYVISFDESGSGVAGLAAISQPENAQVLIDGVSRGFSPYISSTISPAMHTITIKSPGYSDFSSTVKTLDGYRLTFYVKLGKGISEESMALDKKVVQKVTILDTPTGYLRVRTLPGENGEEIAQVDSGSSFAYLDTDVATGWIEIQYQASKSGLPSGITGWVSGKYATVSSILE